LTQPDIRPQYHSRDTKAGRLIWDVRKLIKLAHDLPIKKVPLVQIAEIDENWWYQDGEVPSVRSFVHHTQLMEAADLSYPVLLCAEGRLMDGMHRVAKALMQAKPRIQARQFPKTPPPDFRDVALSDLNYH
jgi:hypothetical protein